jgi:hypothetical protein
MQDQKQNTDPLDAAYLAIGAARAMDKDNLRPLDSELDVISVALSFSSMLQRLWDEFNDGDEWKGGVWAYDVCEPLGAYIVKEACEGDLAPYVSRDSVEQEARRLIAEASR